MWDKLKAKLGSRSNNNSPENDFSLTTIEEGRVSASDDAFDTRREVRNETEKTKVIGAFVLILALLGGYGFYLYNHFSKKEIEPTETQTAGFGGSPKPGLADPFGLGAWEAFNPIPAAASEAAPKEASVNTVDEEVLKQAAIEKEMLNSRYNSGIIGEGSSGGEMAPNTELNNQPSSLPPELLAMYQAAGLIGGQQSANGGNETKANGSPDNLAGRFSGNGSIAPSANATYKSNRSFLIQQGKFIDAALVTDVVSDLPGTIVAMTIYPTYSEEGRNILIPAGTRVFGQYSSDIRYGQAVIDAVWNRAITPSGVEIALDSPSTDTVGVQGLNGGKVNNHFWKAYGNAALISILGSSTAVAGVSDGEENNSKAQFRTDMTNKLSQMAQSQLEQRANIPPTITVKRATRIKIMVAKDLDFSTLMGAE